MFKKNYSKIIDYYSTLTEFKDHETAEKHFFELREKCLHFINALKNNNLNFSAESLTYVESLYKQLEESDGYKKMLNISKDQFRRIFGIYVKEVYVRHNIAKWTVERFFETNAFTFGINTSEGANMRGFDLKDINEQEPDFFSRFSRYYKPKIQNDHIHPEVIHILNEMNNPEICEDGNSKGFHYRKSIQEKLRIEYNNELFKLIEHEKSIDVITQTLVLVKEQLLKFYDYTLMNLLLTKMDSCKKPFDKYYILNCLEQIPKCRSVNYTPFFDYATYYEFSVRGSAIFNLGSFVENKDIILDFLVQLLEKPKKEKDIPDIIEAIGNLKMKESVDILEIYAKNRKLSIKNAAKLALEKIQQS